MELEPRQGGEPTGPVVRDHEEAEEEDEGPTLYEEMMQTALQAKEEKKERQKKQEEEAAARAFDRKGFMKGGFLNRPKKKAAKKAVPKAAAAPTTGMSSKPSSSSATASAKNETVTEVRANPAAQQDSFRFPEVHESLHSQMSGFERTLSSGEWVTDGLKERIHQDPEIRAGMSHPRCQQAIQEMQRDPKAAQEKYRRDPVVSRFIMRWIALMGEHFTELGRRQEAESSSHESSASSAPTAAAAQDTGSAKPLITARETKRPQQRKADVETAGRDAIRQVDADEIAEMASKRACSQRNGGQWHRPFALTAPFGRSVFSLVQVNLRRMMTKCAPSCRTLKWYASCRIRKYRCVTRWLKSDSFPTLVR